MASSISVIIPTLNEASHLEATLQSIGADALEIIVSDGGSRDQTIEVATRLGAIVVREGAGRASQMNAAAAIARGEVLLFLHADTILPADYRRSVADIVCRPGTAGGAFRLGIRGSGVGLRLVETGANLRSVRLSMPYGDQALFLKRDLFWEIGGFAEIPIMEDFELVRRLRQHGRMEIADASVTTSDRRWRKLGVLRTTAWNWIIVVAWSLGVAPHRLAGWYRGDCRQESQD